MALTQTPASGGGSGAVTIVDGGAVTIGALADAAIDTNTTGSLSGKLRGIVKLLASVITGGKVSTDGSSVTQPVSGTFWQATQPVSGTVTANAGTGTLAVSGPLTDAQLRATPVPVSGTVTSNAGTNLNTSALNLEATQALVKAKTDNLDVLLSTRLKPADTLAAVTAITNVVHVDDNAGSLTVDGAVTANAGTNLNTSLLALEAGNLATLAATVKVDGVAFPITGGTGLVTSAVVSEVPTNYTDNEARPLSMTNQGRLRVSMVPADTFLDMFNGGYLFDVPDMTSTINPWEPKGSPSDI